MADLNEQLRSLIAHRPSVFPGMARPSEMYDRYKGWSDRSAAALLAILDLHNPVRQGAGAKVWFECAHCQNASWGGPSVDWPCETVEAIKKELGIEG